ncbi:hypothetical protein PSP6_140030 [Paraburkholderia tropica]|nr:hypothetical protein PSP6_140030 [Paraburkholderia tropica]
MMRFSYKVWGFFIFNWINGNVILWIGLCNFLLAGYLSELLVYWRVCEEWRLRDLGRIPHFFKLEIGTSACLTCGGQ